MKIALTDHRVLVRHARRARDSVSRTPATHVTTTAIPIPPNEAQGHEQGGAEGNRTPDLDTASVALYQLSYSPERARV